MMISGFTIIKNAVINNYPVVEAISSILPVVDEMVVLVGDSTDDTKKLIGGIDDPKIRLFDSVWDSTLRKGGEVLAVETNKAFRLINPNSTWAFYIQADEAVHEKDLPAITDACFKYKDDSRVEGLLFKYLHFYASYEYVGDSRVWYNNEVRIIRNDHKINAYKDAQGFRKGSIKLKVKRVDAYMYHYGWVKSDAQMKNKIKEVTKYWHGDLPVAEQNLQAIELFNFNEFDSLAKFTGTHPAVLAKRIEEQKLNIHLDISKKKFSLKDKILYWFEKKTGIRPFAFRNYKTI